MNRKQLGYLKKVEREVDILLARGCKGMSPEQLQSTHARLLAYLNEISVMRRNELYVIVTKKPENKDEASN